MTGAAKEEFESEVMPLLNGELPEEMAEVFYDMLPAEKADEMVQRIREMMQPTLKQLLGRTEVVSSEHVGDEFHFQIRIPSPEVPGASGFEMPKIPDALHKMHKENGVWQIFFSP